MLLGGDGLPTLSIPTKAFLDEEGLAELEKEMNPPAPVKDVVAKKKGAAKPPAPPKAEEEDARRRVGPARKGADPTAPAATRRPNQFNRPATSAADEAADEAFRVAAAVAEQRNHSDSSDGETVSDSEASQ